MADLLVDGYMLICVWQYSIWMWWRQENTKIHTSKWQIFAVVSMLLLLFDGVFALVRRAQPYTLGSRQLFLAWNACWNISIKCCQIAPAYWQECQIRVVCLSTDHVIHVANPHGWLYFFALFLSLSLLLLKIFRLYRSERHTHTIMHVRAFECYRCSAISRMNRR